jgi:hypothetical protein
MTWLQVVLILLAGAGIALVGQIAWILYQDHRLLYMTVNRVNQIDAWAGAVDRERKQQQFAIPPSPVPPPPLADGAGDVAKG